MTHNKVCRECGAGFESRAYQATYCSEPCKRKANVRRRARGCELYDLTMISIFEAGKSPSADLAHAKIREVVLAYMRADQQKRAGRPSWRPWREVVVELPVKYGEQGDGR